MLGMSGYWIKEGLAKVRRRQADLARHLGYDPSIVSKMITGAREIGHDEAQKIRAYLALPEAETEIPPGAVAVKGPYIDSTPTNVPVHGVAAGNGSADGSFRLEEEIVDFVRRPPGLAKARDVYAIYVTSESMYPAFREGELVYVSTKRPTAIGDDVVLRLKPRHPGDPDEFLIKRLARRNAATVVVEQFNPAGDIHLDTHRVLHMHKVLTMRDLWGV